MTSHYIYSTGTMAYNMTDNTSTSDVIMIHDGISSPRSIGLMFVYALMFVAGLYFAISLSRYFQRHERIRSSTGRGSTQPDSGRAHTAKYGIVLRRLCVVAAVIVLLTTFCGFVTFVTYQLYPSLLYCEGLTKTHHVLRTVTEILFNSILWLRQKIFYLNPAMRHLTSVATNSISWLFYVIMLISTCLALILYANGYSPSPIGNCVMMKNARFLFIPEQAVLGVTITLIIVYRLLFLGLLIYPLLKHGREIRKSNLGEKHVAELLKVIRRVLVADCLCIAIFITVAVLTDSLSQQSAFVLIIIWESELILGFVFIMLSFVDWRRRLLPFCSKRRVVTRRTSSRIGTRVSVWTTNAN